MSIAPDLRCWRLLPDNYQLQRVFFEPGTYELDLIPPGDAQTTWKGETVELEDGSGTGRKTVVASEPVKPAFAIRSDEIDVAAFTHFVIKAIGAPMDIDEADADFAMDTTILTLDMQRNYAGNLGYGLRFNFGVHLQHAGVGGANAITRNVIRFDGALEARYTIIGQANQGFWAGGGLGLGLLGTETITHGAHGAFTADEHEQEDVETDFATFTYGSVSTGYRALLGRYSIHPYANFTFGNIFSLEHTSGGTYDPWKPTRLRAGLLLGY